jgi:hypothetical protein
MASRWFFYLLADLFARTPRRGVPTDAAAAGLPLIPKACGSFATASFCASCAALWPFLAPFSGPFHGEAILRMEYFPAACFISRKTWPALPTHSAKRSFP